MDVRNISDDKIINNLNKTLEEIKTWINWLNKDINIFNNQLKQDINNLLNKRKNEILIIKNKVNNLGYHVKVFQEIKECSVKLKESFKNLKIIL